MQKNNEIQIDVNGLTGIGKSHVMLVIKEALESAYPCAQVVSYDLSVELNGTNKDDLLKPNPSNTIFWLNEGSIADYRVLIGKDKRI